MEILSLKPAIFLDRDGVICEYVEVLTQLEQFKLRPGVGQAIARLNSAGFYVFVATNQPNIAKGKMSAEMNQLIHDKMETLLHEEGGGRLDKIYFCPHRVGGIIPELSYECECRKPKPGMLIQASSEFNIDKTRSLMIGDTWRDVECARRFGIPVFAITGGGGYPYDAGTKDAEYIPDQLFSSLPEAVDHILKVRIS